MKRINKVWLMMIIAPLIFGSTVSVAANQEDSIQQAEETGNDRQAMKTPDEVSRQLAAMVGSWDTELTWLSPPSPDSRPPQVFHGTAVRTMIMGGRYVQEKFQSDFMGRTYTGLGYTSYHNKAGEYRFIWVDNLATGAIVLSAVPPQDASKIFWQGSDAFSVPGKADKLRIVTNQLSADEELLEFYVYPAGAEEKKTMEIRYKRRK